MSFGPRHGYVERPISDRGRALLQRVVVSGGHTSTHVYRSFVYRNTNMAAYVPNVYYRPAFYAWLGSGWQSPVTYQWTWAETGAPAYFAGYYTPPSTYNSPDQWVTDYVLKSTLDESYAYQPQENTAADQTLGTAADMPVLASPSPTPISREVKAQIGAQVARDIALERTEATQVSADPTHGPPVRQDVPAGLDPAVQLFLVGSTLQVVSGTQQCRLREGDVLFLAQPAPNGSASTELLVKSSLKGDCPGEARVTVSIRDLQEMSNHFRENICSAEQTIAANDSTGGRLPTPPDAKPLYAMQQAKATTEQDAQTVQAVEELQTRASQEEKSLEQEMNTPGTPQ